MILFPKVQTKLRDELNSVVGNPEDGTDSPRFPTFLDTQHMPYLQAVVKEVMRYVYCLTWLRQFSYMFYVVT